MAFARAGDIVWQTSRLIGGGISRCGGDGSGGAAHPPRSGTPGRAFCYSATQRRRNHRRCRDTNDHTLGPRGGRSTPLKRSARQNNAAEERRQGFA
ncbi:hypothetical protein CIC12_17920 [Burkholderia sp. SG-MS1]|nr:hypothetical protein [Paraburkholderia sp. SG-MS1]